MWYNGYVGTKSHITQICGGKKMITYYHEHKNDERTFFSSSEEVGANEDNALYLGVELEVDRGGMSNDESDTVAAILGEDFVYFEEDGSLRNGFEIITEPATLAYYKEHAQDWEAVFKRLVKDGYRSHNTATCGLHVHINRNFLSRNFQSEDSSLKSILAVFDKFWDNLVIFSRRTTTNLNRWANKYDKTPTEIVDDMHYGYVDRYHAVNVSNEPTIEFRLFKGTLNPESFFATLELIYSIVNWSTNHFEEEVAGLTWEELLNTETLVSYWERVKNRVVR
jgi:hypothetical protein